MQPGVKKFVYDEGEEARVNAVIEVLSLWMIDWRWSGLK